MAAPRPRRSGTQRAQAEASLFDEPADGPSSAAERSEQAAPAALTVSQLTARIADRLAEFGALRVEGELGGLKRAASGHVYFELKDEGARLSCVVWRSQVARAASWNPKEGDKVVAHGKLDVYAPRGGYSLIVTKLEPLGEGLLLAKLEALKAELRAKGWFERERPLPAYPRCVGLVTSRDGAALRDFLRTRSLRWPGYPVRLCHAPVQGPGSSEALAASLRALEASGVDVIVVLRGGGSIEDLWAFNEEPLLRAVHECAVPVVSAVGHETDVTLCDFVADRRAHTPTDAAQTVLPDRAELTARLERAGGHLARAVDRELARASERLGRAAASRALRDPRSLVHDRTERLAAAHARARGALELVLARAEQRTSEGARRIHAASPRARLERWARRLAQLEPRVLSAVRPMLERTGGRLERLGAQLDAISPLAVLGRGYAVVRTADGRAVRSSEELHAGDRIGLRFARGRADAMVERIEHESGE